LAGFLEPYTGEVRVAGRAVCGISPAGRNLGTVFQAYSLWPHMSVADNMGFGLACRGICGEQRRRRVEACLDLVHLGGYGARLPRELSGGQQQRVALARALAYEHAGNGSTESSLARAVKSRSAS
jgi:ABC-type Fe3+/spermidine/putrescine transport system ATPase subunit